MITVHRVKDKDELTLALTIVIDSAESLKQFKELVQRATNLWPDAHPDIKDFADLVTNEKIFQDYHSQNTDLRKSCDHPNTQAINPINGYYLRCLKCGIEFNLNEME